MNGFLETVVSFLIGLLLIFVVALIIAFPVMWVWNWVIPGVFGLIKINFWQAFGINLLCGLLFRRVGSIRK